MPLLWTTSNSVTRLPRSSHRKTWKKTQLRHLTRSRRRQSCNKKRHWQKLKRMSSTAACRDSACTLDITVFWLNRSSKTKTSLRAGLLQCRGSGQFLTIWSYWRLSGNSSWSTNASKRRQRTRSTIWSSTGCCDTIRETLSEKEDGC